ncbi:hypothetical protein E3N88_44465 [Mikania micrantha]|uniref:FAR1 domain-containing protein n=1 Tax=Mikania micrantha TaxID=192012 RepID=A0A5N6LCK2_9ASTR|nr:hypothetical protein E3N88_44465 [Mikania micrantha]
MRKKTSDGEREDERRSGGEDKWWKRRRLGGSADQRLGRIWNVEDNFKGSGDGNEDLILKIKLRCVIAFCFVFACNYVGKVLPSSGVLDDVCDVFDDYDVYIPLPLSNEEPSQAQDSPMQLNEIMGDVVDVYDVLEPLSIEKERLSATYQDYAMNCGFSVRVGQTKRNKDDVITHKYLRCNKSGRPQSKRKSDTLAESSLHFRKSSYQVTDCKAHIGVQFIHHMTLNRIGPTIAHRLQVSMKGGHHNVKGTPTDFKNFSQAIRLFIGNRDSQLFLDHLRDRVQNLPDFYFDFCVVNGELRHAFWADEISKRNY